MKILNMFSMTFKIECLLMLQERKTTFHSLIYMIDTMDIQEAKLKMHRVY